MRAGAQYPYGAPAAPMLPSPRVTYTSPTSRIPTGPTNVPNVQGLDLVLPAFESLAISVSQPDPRAVNPTPTSARPHSYEGVFESIINFATALRPSKPLSSDERKIARTLAGPFTQGGLLVLLQEPRANHPWAQGVDWVISDCASLAILREGLQTVSSGELSITTNVSVIDRWPFLHQKLHSDLDKTAPEDMATLDSMVFNAIRAKKPDVILCMGKVRATIVELYWVTWLTLAPKFPKEFLEPRLINLVSTPGTTVRVVYAMHPSHSANYKKDCRPRRDDLYIAIQTAYSLFKDREQYAPPPGLRLPKPPPNGLPLVGMYSAMQPADTKDSQAIQDLLEQLAELCVPPGHVPLTPCLSPPDRPSYFAFQSRQQLENLNHAHLCLGGPGQRDLRRRARAALIPTLMRLNGALARTTYFAPDYEVDWTALLAALAAAPPDLEALLLEAGGWDARGYRGTGAPLAAAVANGRNAAIGWVKGLLDRRRMLQANPRQPAPEPVDVLFGNRYRTCRCNTGFRYDDLQLQEAFRGGYVPTHDCAPCRFRRARLFTKTVGLRWVSGLQE